MVSSVCVLKVWWLFVDFGGVVWFVRVNVVWERMRFYCRFI